VQLGSNHIKVLLKAFGVFHKMAVELAVLLRQNHLIKSTADVRRELAHAFQEFAHFTSEVKEYLTMQCLGMFFGESSVPD
jgi:hypothetical protein